MSESFYVCESISTEKNKNRISKGYRACINPPCAGSASRHQRFNDVSFPSEIFHAMCDFYSDV